jgi:hypothetical protein
MNNVLLNKLAQGRKRKLFRASKDELLLLCNAKLEKGSKYVFENAPRRGVQYTDEEIQTSYVVAKILSSKAPKSLKIETLATMVSNCR